ncbi:hypothetical protein [Streptomyces sp. MT206]|uniref:hypothetical protein n=1 Tax=Streptomyces sp. MT206 TaxID=3031407 RepID=UPI002FC9157F
MSSKETLGPGGHHAGSSGGGRSGVGAFKHHHLLAEAHRHLAYVLRGRPHQLGLDDRSCRPPSATTPARPVTADLRALYPDDEEIRPCCAR